MKIAILGSGNLGTALASRWASHGHQIVFGTRDPQCERALSLAAQLPSVQAHSIPDAVAMSDVVVNATPWKAAQEVLKCAGDLRDKILIDCTNPLAPNLGGLLVGHTTSAAEQIAEWAPGARVVKAYNTAGTATVYEPHFSSDRLTMFICGDDEAAKETVAELTEQLGFEAVDAGPLSAARLLEPLALLLIDQAVYRGKGPFIGLKLIRRKAAS